MNTSIDLAKARKNITNLTHHAGEILKKYFFSQNYSQRSKSGVDFTTQADEEVDSFLMKEIRKQYPKTFFLTEETAPEDFAAYKHTDNLWVIDPLDGTINFSRQHPNFAISVALMSQGIPQLAVVFKPITDDLYWAQTDKEGAFLNDKPLHVSQTTNMGEATIACDWAWALEKRLTLVHWLEHICTHIRQIKSMGSAVADLASVAQGKIDAYIHSGLKPWDMAAAALLIEKAGGRVTTASNIRWDAFQPTIIASNGILHDAILKLVNDKGK